MKGKKMKDAALSLQAAAMRSFSFVVRELQLVVCRLLIVDITGITASQGFYLTNEHKPTFRGYVEYFPSNFHPLQI